MRLHYVLLRYFLFHALSCKLLIWILYDEHVLFIMDGLFWASLFFNVGGELFGGLFFTLPFEGINFSAHDQDIIYTHHEWRERQHGVGCDAYHIHIFHPPSFLKLEVEGDFQELPYWEVTHFVWMIAWGWRVHMRKIFLITFQTPCLGWRISSSILAVA